MSTYQLPGTFSGSSSGGGGGFVLPGTFSSGGGSGKKKKDDGLLGDALHVAGIALHPVTALAKDVGEAGINFFPGLYEVGKLAVTDPEKLPTLVTAIVKQYEDYYGHDILHHLWDHPLQPILDGLTVLSGGAAGAAKLGEIGNIAKLAELGQRTSLVTRSPELIRTGEGPSIVRLSSNKPIVKLRQQVVNKMQQRLSDFGVAGGRGRNYQGIGSEYRSWGKAIGDDAIHQAIKDSTKSVTHERAFARLSKDERVALGMRSLDIHPANLREWWGTATEPGKLGRLTVNGKQLNDKVYDLILNPEQSERLMKAEAQSRALSVSGAELLKRRGALSAESEIDRPERFKEMLASHLGHPVETLHDDPWYLPHTTSSQFRKGSHPMQNVGGGRAEPKAPGSTKQNVGELFRQGKLDFNNDVLGAEYLRRVKWLKFWQIHEGLKDGAIRWSWDDLHNHDASGMPPKGYDFLRASVGGQKQKIPFSVRGESEREMHPRMRATGKSAPVSSDLERYVPDPTDLQRSSLSEGFTTRHIADAATDEDGRYFLVPTKAARAATGEFTRMSDFMYNWARRPLRVWRAALLGLRPAFLVNNVVGNALMYAMKVGGTGAIRDLYMSMRESHSDKVMLRLLKDPATPSDVRLELMRQFHPDELTGGRWAGELTESTRAANRTGGLAREGALEGEVIPPGATTPIRDAVEAPGTVLPDAPQFEHVRDFYTTFYPEQRAGGTFGTTQSPSTEELLRGTTGRPSAAGVGRVAADKTARGWEKTTGFLPKVTSKVAEEVPRAALIRNLIRRSPEFKAVYKSMPRESRSFLAAAYKLHRGEGGEAFQKMISQQVDRALGNYTRLSPLERLRNALRNLMPFYAWYRAIVQTTFHLAVDNPLRAQLLYRLGQIGAETALQQQGALPLPSYLQGAIPLGAGPKGTTRALATQSLNPWATIGQLARGGTADISDLGLNPFVMGGLEAFRTLSSGPGGTTKPVSLQALVTEMLTQIVKGLPPYAQVFPKGPSKLYPNRGYQSAWEAWAGAPIKEYNPFIAAQRAREQTG